MRRWTPALIALAPTLLFGCGSHSPSTTRGAASAPQRAGGFDAGSDTECGKVLDGDLFDKVSQAGTSTERDLAQLRFFTLSDQEAWQVYQQAKHTSSSGNGSLGVSVIDLVDVAAGGGGSGASDFNEFQGAFRRARQEFDQYVKTDRYRNASDAYTSVVRDAASVQAWAACIQQSGGAPKFRLVLRRQSATTALAQVFYSAGDFGGSLPQLLVAFTGGHPGGDGPQPTVGQGSKIFTLALDQDAASIGVTGTTADGNTNFSFVEPLPPTKAEFNASRCHLQNSLMLMGGKVSLPIFTALEAADYVAFPVDYAPRSHGSEACSAWLAGV